MITGTIAICTRNRAASLRTCLRSVATQVGEPGELEVLVVDNGSSDGTRDLLRDWQRGGTDRRVVEEPRPGLSLARNAALAACDRDVVVFTDDDALTPPGWARAHLRAYRDPTVGAAGGPVGLIWPHGRPGWVTEEFAGWYGALDLGDEPCPFPDPHGPYGVNMSVRRDAAHRAGGFDPVLGRTDGNLLSGEEPDMTRRLVDAGWQIRYEPTAAVVHQVAAERATRRWLVRRGWSQGVTNARLAVLAEHPGRTGVLRRSAGQAGLSVTTWRDAGGKVRGRPDLAAQVRSVHHAGAAVEFLRLSLRRSAGERR